MEWFYKLYEKITGKHIHSFSNQVKTEYLDGTKVYRCRCGKMAKTTY